MQVDFERYAPINTPFEDRKVPGSLQFKRQGRYTLNDGGGTYGMSNIRFQKQMKHISSGGYTVQRGPSTQYFKVPRGQSVRALRIAQQIPRSGSIMRVVGTENAEEQVPQLGKEFVNDNGGGSGGDGSNGGRGQPPTQSSFYAISPNSFPRQHQSSGINTPNGDISINYGSERDNLAVSRRGVPGIFAPPPAYQPQPPPPTTTGGRQRLYPSLEDDEDWQMFKEGKSRIVELPADEYELPDTGNLSVVRQSGSSAGTSPTSEKSSSPPPMTQVGKSFKRF